MAETFKTKTIGQVLIVFLCLIGSVNADNNGKINRHNFVPDSFARKKLNLLKQNLAKSLSERGVSYSFSNLNSNLRVELIRLENLVVDHNIQTPAGAGPKAVFIGAHICNDGPTELTDLIAYAGDYQSNTPGIYAERTVSENGYSGTFSFTHEGGTADATRYIGTLPVGECVMQYWLISYPLLDANNNKVTGSIPDQTDDLWLTYDIWADANDNGTPIYDTQKDTLQLRAEISASANKIWPNNTAKVPKEYLDAFPDKELGWREITQNTDVGTILTLEGIWFDLGNIQKGFDNNGDFVPDYNFMLQPVGNPDIFDPNCFRLIRTSGFIIIKLKGNKEEVIEFEDQLFFSDISDDNTGGVGMVFYEFAVLNGDCVAQLSPYQEVASGLNNEKFNSDYGTAGGDLASTLPKEEEISFEKTAPLTTSPGSQIQYQLTLDNTSGTTKIGLPEYGSPLIFQNTIPQNTAYAAGTAGINNMLPSGNSATVLYSTDNGSNWSNTEPSPASDVTDLQWWVKESVNIGETATVTFDIIIDTNYPDPTINNNSGVSLGNMNPFLEDATVTTLIGPNAIDIMVYEEDKEGSETALPNITVCLYEDTNGNEILDSGEPLLLTDETLANGTVKFPNLLNGDYIAVADSNDLDLPIGLINSTDLSVSVLNLGIEGRNVKFGFIPLLDIDETLISSDKINEGDSVVFTLDITNNNVIPGSNPPTYVDFDSIPFNKNYNPNLLEYLSSSVVPDSINTSTGKLIWNNINNKTPINVNFRALNPSFNNESTEIIARSEGTTFTDGKIAGSVTDTASVSISGSGSFRGNLFWDANEDGEQDWNESNIPDITVYLKDSLGNVIDSTVTNSGNTDSVGVYVFDNLVNGKYTVLVDETDPDLMGAILITDPSSDGVPCIDPNALGCDHEYTSTLSSGAKITWSNFGYRPIGVLGDLIWLDTDGDGIKDDEEDGMPNIGVIITNHTTVEIDETSYAPDSYRDTIYTDFDGLFTFSDLPDGTWEVKVELPLDHVGTYDVDGIINNNTLVTITNGLVSNAGNAWCLDLDCSLALDFGLKENGAYAISGTICIDDNSGDGTCNTGGEIKLEGHTLSILDANGDLNGQVETDINGDFLFAGLTTGTYYVALNTSQSPIDLMTTTTDATDTPASEVKSTGSGVHQIVTLSDNITGLDFAFSYTQDMDFGDLPFPYFTLIEDSPSGAYHILPDVPNLYLGSMVDSETNGNQTDDANGDNTSGNSDEDGVSFTDPFSWTVGTAAAGKGGALSATVSGQGWLTGWLDFDKSGDFGGEGEMIINQAVNTGVYDIEFDIPAYADLEDGEPLYARFRLFEKSPIVPQISYYGRAINGEVEDYRILFCNNLDDAGTIGPNQEFCGSFNPTTIIEQVVPSGGFGSTEYQWQFNVGSGWTDILGANVSSFDPGTLTETTLYRRGARNYPCTDWIYSNEVTITIIENGLSGGIIDSDEEGCGSFDPLIITNISSPEGSGGSLEYQWQKEDGNGWEDISGAISEAYNPPVILVTTQYRRRARRSPCTGFVYSNIVTKSIISNYSDGGAISGEESSCGSYDPNPISGINSPNGGSFGTLEYVWQSNSGTGWSDLSDSNSDPYNPETITQTTEYRRGARRSPCSNWVYSNSVTKEVVINHSDGGIISEDEGNCIGYDPSPIIGISNPSGGNDGMIEYLWQKDEGSGWTDISGANSEYYDPTSILQTTYYRRGVRLSPCTNWSYSNTVTKMVNVCMEICDNDLDDDGDGFTDCEDMDCQPMITYTSSDENCGMEDGSIDITLTGNNVPYSYLWDDMPLTARWTFEQNTNDVSGNNHHQNGGAGTPAYDADRIEGAYSLRLDGSTYLRYSVDGDFMEKAFSQWFFMGWIKPDNLTGYQTIIDEGSGTNGISIRLNGNILEAAVRNGGSDSQMNAVPVTFPNDGAWHHVTAVFDNGLFTLFLDGVSGGSSNASFSTVNAHSGNGGIGWTDGGSGFGSGSGDYFTGLMDDLRYGFELTLSENQIADVARNDGDRINVSAGIYTLTATSATGCSSIESVEIGGSTNFTDGGIIDTDEDNCGNFDPAIISNIFYPGGGTGGTIEYQWEYNNGNGWTVITGSNADSYDPDLISQTTQYRRGARRNPCTSWVYSNTVTKSAVTNTSTGGTINGNETACGSYDPEVILSTNLPSGGIGGTLEYQWQKDEGIGWTDIPSSNSESYNPGVISMSTQFRRGIRRLPCTDWIYSNIATKTVVQNYTNPGLISGEEENCGNFDPVIMVGVTLPSGGNGGTLEYQWQKNEGTGWTDIMGTNADSHNPGLITKTTQYRRGTRRTPCSNWVYSNIITKRVTLNFTSGGTIAASESPCGVYTPSEIISLSAPSGGIDGTILYQWESSLNGMDWTLIIGEESENYTPPTVAETKYYRRKARRTPCSVWINSNTVIKTYSPIPVADISTYPVGANNNICELEDYVFEATEVADAVYTWNFGAHASPSTATGKGPHIVQFNVPDGTPITTVTADLTVNLNGCETSDSRSFNVRPAIVVTGVNVKHLSSCNANNSKIDIIATWPEGTQIQVSTDGGNSWEFPGELSFNGLPVGTHEIRVRYDNSDCETIYGNIKIEEPNAPEGIMNISSSSTCLGGNFLVEVTPTSGTPLITWDFGTGATPATATGEGSHIVSYDSEGFKTITATLTENSCQSIISHTVSVVTNFTEGGSIEGDEALCGTNDPSLIAHAGNPSGGNYGTTEYRWQKSLDGINWTDISGTNANTYDPPVISQTTYFRRKARRSPCGSWHISNHATKILTDFPIANDDYFDTACPGLVYTDNVGHNDENLINTTFTIVVPPSNGTVDLDNDGEFFYEPASTFCGTDDFTYQICNEGSDCCQLATAVIDLSDVSSPSLLNIPSDITIHCDEEFPSPSLVNAVENCQSVTLGLAETSTQNSDTCSAYQYTLSRTWTAVDYCGNDISNQQNIHVRDITRPDIYRIYTLPNGKKLVAGVMENTTNRWKNISFPIEFDTNPIVFAQVVSENESSTVITRLRNISTTQFQLKLQEEENNDGIHIEEDVAWIAVESGTGTDLMPFEVGSVLASSASTSINFSQIFNQNPAFISTIQSDNEINPATIRYNSLTNSGVNFFIEEETSADFETSHGTETVGYFACENTGTLVNSNEEVFGEVGTVWINASVQTILLDNTYHNPVVVLGGVSQNEMTPVTISVTNVTQNTFDIRLKEWDYDDDNHIAETVSYIVVEGSIPLDTYANCDDLADPPTLYSEIRGVDNCDVSISVNYSQIFPNFDCDRDSLVIRTWSVEDECGNSDSYSQTIILRDTEAPTFTVPADVTITCGQSIDPSITGDVTDETDNCSAAIEAVYTDNLGNLDGCLGYYERIWTLTDLCGNSISKSQIINISDPNDSDRDGKPNPFDLDDDNDGIPDVDELFIDTDGDGITNELDLDSDNDGIPDIIEAGFRDINGDGMVDNINLFGWDDDGDGFADGFDADDNDPSLEASDDFEPTDFMHDRDGDGIMNQWDLDSDNDGIPDLIEAGGVDTNGDGLIDYPIPLDPTSMEDGDGDGFADIYDVDDDGLEFAEDILEPLVLYDGGFYRSGTPSQNPDSDFDQIPDFWDLDSDNDTAPDLIESGGVDENGDGRVDDNEFLDNDSNGFHDDYTLHPLITTDADGQTSDGRPEDTNGDGLIYYGADIDGDGLLNHRDLDSDNDGITDILEIGNLTFDNDNDGDLDAMIDLNFDGFDDNQSAYPRILTEADGNTNDGRPEDGFDSNNSPYLSSLPDGAFGILNGEPDVDEDFDGILNLADEDSDNDLILDENEDKNGNGQTDPGERNYLDPDTDNDFILDGIEDENRDGDFDKGETDPLNPDTDYDSLPDGTEDADQNGSVDIGESEPRDPCDPNPSNYCKGIVLDLKVKLQGAMMDNGGGGLMRDDLRQKELLPLKEPYSNHEYLNHVGEGGNEKIAESLLEVTGNNAVVDWILIELRSAVRADSVVATKSAILQRDGDITDTEGNSPIILNETPSDDYYVAIRHRNHLGIITANTYFLSPIPTELDFTNIATNVYGDYPRANLNGEHLMWSGDLNQDRQSIYQGVSNDIMDLFIKIMLDSVNVSFLTNFISKGYYTQDLNLDGNLIFQGPDNERSKMLFNVTLNTPQNLHNYVNFIVGEDLPENDNGTADDPCLKGATNPICDFDRDGLINAIDLDDDNDGVPDLNDINPFDPESDSDSDGLPDNHETGGDGNYDIGIDTNPLSPDTDNDGLADNIEDKNANRFTDKDETNPLVADTDNDGINDGVEDSNLNGVLDSGESDPTAVCDPNPIFAFCDFDGDGIPNNIDLDDDNDGVPDSEDADSFDNTTDSDGDGISDMTETDGDGVYHPLLDSDPLNICDPNPNQIGCVGIDLDGDGYFSNYPKSHPMYDADDTNICFPEEGNCP